MKPRILVAEDDTIIAMELRIRLESAGYALVAVVSRAEDAVQKATETRPDLVLMDVRLRGGIDGIEAAARIRACCDVPVVYLTALADAETLQRAQSAGLAGYIVKPFDETQLYLTIETALRGSRGHERA